MRRIVILAVSGIALCAASAAYAEHGKVGHWDITVKNEFPGLPRLTPTEEEQYKMRGIPVPDRRTKHMGHCMTAEEVASTTLPKLSKDKTCTISNQQITGQTFQAHISCSGMFEGEGGLSVTYDKPEHYSGTAKVDGSFSGQQLEMISHFEGTWTSATCESDDE